MRTVGHRRVLDVELVELVGVTHKPELERTEVVMESLVDPPLDVDIHNPDSLSAVVGMVAAVEGMVAAEVGMVAAAEGMVAAAEEMVAVAVVLGTEIVVADTLCSAEEQMAGTEADMWSELHWIRYISVRRTVWIHCFDAAARFGHTRNNLHSLAIGDKIAYAVENQTETQRPGVHRKTRKRTQYFD